MPTLTIIAGPNGAGKSTHSKELLSDTGIEAFDFDKEFYAVWSRFSFDPLVEQGAINRTHELYIERRDSALAERRDFAFETNYHTAEVLNVVNNFKASGYWVELIFVCLESPEMAMERVKDRVKKGGHSVDEGTIRSRFESGLKRLDNTFEQFDLVTIYLSIENGMELAMVLGTEGGNFEVLMPLPISVRRSLKKLEEFVI